MYDIPDPLQLLQQDPWDKSTWKEFIITKILAFHEKKLRVVAENNSKLAYMNVSTTGLRGRHHPVLDNIVTAYEIKKLRPVLKMLCGDYYTYSVRADQSGGSPHCRICPPSAAASDSDPSPAEDLQHILTECAATEEPRSRILEGLEKCLSTSTVTIPGPGQLGKVYCDIKSLDKSTLTQFILDCCSLNLPNSVRISVSDPKRTEIFKLCRDLCYSVHSERLRKLREKDKNG